MEKDDLDFLLDFYNSLPKGKTKDRVEKKIADILELEKDVYTKDFIEPLIKIAKQVKNAIRYEYQRPTWINENTYSDMVKVLSKIEEEE